MWVNNLIVSSLESASSFIELQLTSVRLQGVPQFESIAQGMSLPKEVSVNSSIYAILSLGGSVEIGIIFIWLVSKLISSTP